MPRNSSGTYSLPEPSFIPSTPISSTAVNSDFSDVATALTDSLSRTGNGGMQAQLSLNPNGFVYSGDSDTGMSRSGSNAQVVTCGGVNTIAVSATGVAITGTLAVSGAFAVGGNPLLLTGEIRMFSGRNAPSGWLECGGQTVLRATYPALWTFAQTEIANGNELFTNGDGSSTFTVPDLRGRSPFGKDDMAGSAANRLTSTTMSPGGTTYGATGGAQTVTIAQGNLPAVTLTTTVPDPHHHQTSGLGLVAVQNGTGSTQGNLLTTSGGSPVVLDTGNNTAPLTPASTPLGGSGTALTNVPPALIVNFIIYAGA